MSDHADIVREALRGSTGYKVDSALAALDALVASEGQVTVVDLYTIQIEFDAEQYDDAPVRYHASINAAVAEAEENLTDLLPAGYRARIRRWDRAEAAEDELAAYKQGPWWATVDARRVAEAERDEALKRSDWLRDALAFLIAEAHGWQPKLQAATEERDRIRNAAEWLIANRAHRGEAHAWELLAEALAGDPRNRDDNPHPDE